MIFDLLRAAIRHFDPEGQGSMIKERGKDVVDWTMSTTHVGERESRLMKAEIDMVVKGCKLMNP